MTAQLMKTFNLCGQLDMILFVKLLFGVAFEVGILRNRQLRRVKKNEVSRLRVFFQNCLVVTANDRGVAE